MGEQPIWRIQNQPDTRDLHLVFGIKGPNKYPVLYITDNITLAKEKSQ